MVTQMVIPSLFRSRVALSAEGCWIWTGGLHDGYARPSVDGQRVYGHRYLYEMMVGPIGEGLELDHLCRERSCIRPSHLEPVTHAENVRRGDLWKVSGAKTHCPQGHGYTTANTHVVPSGKRRCQTCHRDQARSYYRAARKEGVPL